MRATKITYPLLAAAILSMLVTGCGNFSNEDLIFLAALPGRDQVALRIPGNEDRNNSTQSLSSQSQSLTSCNQDNLHCQAVNVSNGINAAVFGLLNLVDAIANVPPTRREPGLRVWGPHYAIESNTTLRFEMRRETVGKIDIFEYCLHAVKGRADTQMAEDIVCDREVDDSGLVRLMHGSFSPGAEGSGGARYGAGSLVFDLNAAQDAGVAKPDDRGRFTVDYDNTEEQTIIELHIREVMGDDGTFLPASADYVYHGQHDGSGDFRFTLNADFVGGFIFSDLEQLEIAAQWRADEAGRADATVSGGDLVNTVVSATHCWDAELEGVYYSDSEEEHPTTGQASDCAFATPLP